MTHVDDYVIDTLMPDLIGHDRRPSAFLVYLHLDHRSRGARTRTLQVSLRAISEGTGVSKRSVQAGLSILLRRRLVAVQRHGRTAIPSYTVLTPWERGRV